METSPATTAITHDALPDTPVRTRTNLLSYTKRITYKATLGQSEALIQASTNCSQFLLYKCKGAVLGNGYFAWESRDGEMLYYFPGGAPDGRGCPCAIDRSCYRGTNCLLNIIM